MSEFQISNVEVQGLYEKLSREAESFGYHLNTDVAFTKELIRGLLVNQRRYGYRACPCRLASGDRKKDLDIICPCDYRDADITEYGSCYCALYISRDVLRGEKIVSSIPERRPPEKERESQQRPSKVTGELRFPVWRCRVCGYLCARERPPDVCPICGAQGERFDRFL